MRIDLTDLRRHYASLPDEELLSLNRDELTEAAQVVYDEEIEARGLGEDAEFDEVVEVDEDGRVVQDLGEMDDGDGPEPAWLEDGACACSFVIQPNNAAAVKASQARTVLHNAGIPSRLTVTQEEPADDDTPIREIVNVVVPGALALHATSILDRDLFNEDHDSEWRTHLDVLSDDDLLSLDPKVFCAGLLDRVARMRRAYAEELERRALEPRST